MMTALNVVVAAVYFATSFFALPNIPGFGKSIGTDLDGILISLPILLISIILIIYEQHLRLWILPDKTSEKRIPNNEACMNLCTYTSFEKSVTFYPFLRLYIIKGTGIIWTIFV